VSFASLLGARRHARRVPLIALVFAASLPMLGHAADKPFNGTAAIAPSLNHVHAPVFGFSRGPGVLDVATADAHAFSHFHFDEQLHQRIEAVAEEKRNEIDPTQVAKLLSKAKRASAFAMAAPAAAPKDAASRRVAEALAPVVEQAPVVLAYASHAPVKENEPLAAIASVAPTDDDTSLASLEPEAEDESLLPESILLPDARPELARSKPQEAAKPEKPAKPVVVQEDEPDKPGQRLSRAERLALARPENPDRENKSLGSSFRNLFGGPKAGNGVAVYDISARKVYMPDGSVLEAASGIGKMANNPSYAHVKMNGPTPPDTYHLRMRESRFHGVEAIRMLPVSGKNKYGRTGILAHTQLLRGRPGQSHGCVAFKDYNKFLRAFKQGKVKQIIVVPRGGAAVARRSVRGKDV
jgi:hypothetical protein